MISTHFSMRFPIKIDMFSLSLLLVNHMRYECCAGGMTYHDQWSLFPTTGGLGRFKPPSCSSQSPDGGPRGKTPEDLEILHLTFAKNAKNKPSWSIYPKLQFHEFC